MKILIGRKEEQKLVKECFESDRSELVSVYGRHGVGKTYLIKRCFDEKFDFWFTGIYKATRAQQLDRFQSELFEKSGVKINKIKDNLSNIQDDFLGYHHNLKQKIKEKHHN